MTTNKSRSCTTIFTVIFLLFLSARSLNAMTLYSQTDASVDMGNNGCQNFPMPYAVTNISQATFGVRWTGGSGNGYWDSFGGGTLAYIPNDPSNGFDFGVSPSQLNSGDTFLSNEVYSYSHYPDLISLNTNEKN